MVGIARIHVVMCNALYGTQNRTCVVSLEREPPPPNIKIQKPKQKWCIVTVKVGEDERGERTLLQFSQMQIQLS